MGTGFSRLRVWVSTGYTGNMGTKTHKGMYAHGLSVKDYKYNLFYNYMLVPPQAHHK